MPWCTQNMLPKLHSGVLWVLGAEEGVGWGGEGIEGKAMKRTCVSLHPTFAGADLGTEVYTTCDQWVSATCKASCYRARLPS